MKITLTDGRVIGTRIGSALGGIHVTEYRLCEADVRELIRSPHYLHTMLLRFAPKVNPDKVIGRSKE